MCNKKGFTLIELLTVAIIISILTAIAVPQYRSTIQRAEATEALINLRNVFESAMRYKSQNSTTPQQVSQLDISFFDSLDQSGKVAYIGNFRYSFESSYIDACRLNPDNTYNTYCFRIYYNHDTYGRGALRCNYSTEKYSQICSSFCNTNRDSNPCWVDVVSD